MTILAVQRQFIADDLFLRNEISRFQGEEISRGEGRIIVGFDGPSRAIHCARALVNAANEFALPLRLSLHTGECELVDGELSGLAIQIAEKILEVDTSHQILVSSTVRDLVAGSGFQFIECGECNIDEIPGELIIYSLEE